MVARLLGGLTLVVGLVVPVSAQVSIRVVDAEGRPIPAIRIDVYGFGELIAVESTSAQGTAELSSERWSDVRRISLTHLGFQARIVQAEDIPDDGVVRLEPEAIDIEGLAVEADAPCPISDEPVARRLWSEVASRYVEDTGSRPWLAYLSTYGGSVREEDLHRTTNVESVHYIAAGGGLGVIHGGDYTHRPLDDRIWTEGYAWPPLVIGGTTTGRELAWGYRYPELDRAHAHHFTSAVFGALHDFAVATETETQTTLVFCGNGEGNGATMNGTLTLVPGEGLVSAEWRFLTSDPDEGAGGSVTFAAYVERPGSKPHLVASRGLFYRHNGIEPRYPTLSRTYERFGTAQARWHLLPVGDKPCNTGLSFHGDPPRTPESIQFAQCVADHWGRR